MFMLKDRVTLYVQYHEEKKVAVIFLIKMKEVGLLNVCP